MNSLKRFILGVFVLTAFLQSAPGVEAQNASLNTKNIVKHGFTQLFTYDPTNSGTVSVAYVNKFSRLAALIVQPHTNPRTAAGYIFQGLQGLPLSTATYSIDISDDTVVTNKANLYLIGVDHSGLTHLHQALGLNFASRAASAPNWTTYNYTASKFTPAIGSDETFASLSISLLGGTTTNPDHDGHWLSHPVINGVNVLELVNDSVVVTDGRLVGF
ncbi:MAG TPA: hypothetical protein V6C76_06670 [Drouetiella sp.]